MDTREYMEHHSEHEADDSGEIMWRYKDNDYEGIEDCLGKIFHDRDNEDAQLELWGWVNEDYTIPDIVVMMTDNEPRAVWDFFVDSYVSHLHGTMSFNKLRDLAEFHGAEEVRYRWLTRQARS